MLSEIIYPELRYCSSRLQFRYPFRIAHGMRAGTDVVLVKLSISEHFGLGEATLPPYLGWNTEDIENRLHQIKIDIDLNHSTPVWSANTTLLDDCLPAKAAVDMAVWNLFASIKQHPIASMLGLPAITVPHTYTLGISDLDEMKTKLEFAQEQGFRLFKLKMDGLHDRQMLAQFKSLSDSAFAIDANQGWLPGAETNAFAKELAAVGCVLIEQPFHRDAHEASRLLSNEVSIPIIGDEAIQTMADLHVHGMHYDGINIKLQKCGGITGALPMIRFCQEHNKKILIGCMSESSIGCNTAETLVSCATWADLDGPWLIANNAEILERANSL